MRHEVLFIGLTFFLLALASLIVVFWAMGQVRQERERREIQRSAQRAFDAEEERRQELRM